MPVGFDVTVPVPVPFLAIVIAGARRRVSFPKRRSSTVRARGADQEAGRSCRGVVAAVNVAGAPERASGEHGRSKTTVTPCGSVSVLSVNASVRPFRAMAT